MRYSKEVIDWLYGTEFQLCRFWIIFNELWPEGSYEDKAALELWEIESERYNHNLKKCIGEIITTMPKANRKKFDVAVIAARLKS